jgi:hypothetical protein
MSVPRGISGENIEDRIAKRLHLCRALTDTNVAGKKIAVTIAIVFMAVLSSFDACEILDVVRLKYYASISELQGGLGFLESANALTKF